MSSSHSKTFFFFGGAFLEPWGLINSKEQCGLDLATFRAQREAPRRRREQKMKSIILLTCLLSAPAERYGLEALKAFLTAPFSHFLLLVTSLVFGKDLRPRQTDQVLHALVLAF